MYATVLMDIEDLVAPEADDLAKVCAEILTEENVPATLCIVGERARQWRERGRLDVVAALAQHDIAFHTDLHSVPPSIAQFLQDKGWEDGVEEALRYEKPGVQAVSEVFGVMPSCWGGPGNTWGPQICEAMRQCDVPAFVYAHTAVPEGGVHRFAGLLAYPNGRYQDDGSYHDDVKAAANRERLRGELEADKAAGIFWQQIFLGHPTRILHESFWDAMNFPDGMETPREQWKPAPRKSQTDLENALRNFREVVRMVRNLPGLTLVTIREMNERLAKLPTTPLTPEEQETVWPGIEHDLQSMKGWPVLPPTIDLTRIVAETKAKLPTLERFSALA